MTHGAVRCSAWLGVMVIFWDGVQGVTAIWAELERICDNACRRIEPLQIAAAVQTVGAWKSKKANDGARDRNDGAKRKIQRVGL